MVVTGCEFFEDDDAEASYNSDVNPIFATDPWYGTLFGGKCISCHHLGSPTGLDLTQPFDATVGLVNVPSGWPDQGLRVAPGNVAASFLVDKIARTDLDPAVEGYPMPLQKIPRLTAVEVQVVKQWITDGARNDAFYTTNVAPIFGDGQSVATAGKCSICHYPGSPTGLDLTDPFDPDTGAVNVTSAWRDPGLRVAPGNVAASFLVDKIERTDLNPETEGRPMPLLYPRLYSNEVETVRTWIREGANNN
jgi:mono/diheme cytochrome c family protein